MMTRLTLISIALFATLRADTLTLRDGTRATGTWAGADADQVMFVVNGETKSYPRSDVSRVTFGSAPALPSAVAVEPMPAAPPSPTPPPATAAQQNRGTVLELVGAIYLSGEGGALKLLERREGTPGTFLGLPPPPGSPGSYMWELDGAKSPVRVTSGQKMLFVVRLAGADPGGFKVYPLAAKKNGRRAVIWERKSDGIRTIRLNVTQVGNSVYGLTPIEDLPAGEYAFGFGNRADLYCFGVDSPTAR